MEVVGKSAILCLLLCAGTPLFGSEQRREIATTPSDFIKVDGRQLRTSDGSEVLLRGVALYPPKPLDPEDKEYADIAAIGANTVRLAFRYQFFYDDATPRIYKDSGWNWLDAHLALARKHKLHVVLQMLDIEGVQFVPVTGAPFDYRIWKDRELQRRFINLWRAIASRYKNETQLVGFSLFYEPVTSGGVEQWRDLANRTIRAIRDVDRNHVVFVERIWGENEVRREVSGLDLPPEKAFFLVDDPNVVYEFYFFERDEYTHQFAPWRSELQKPVTYPDPGWKIVYRERPGSLQREMPFDQEYLRFYLSRQTEFGKRHNVPMFVWGFGALPSCFTEGRGGERWLADVIELFNAAGLHWTFWAYRDDSFAGIADFPQVRRIVAEGLRADTCCYK